jgi:hypothetical protein
MVLRGHGSGQQKQGSAFWHWGPGFLHAS